jgi:hypothetical protein
VAPVEVLFGILVFVFALIGIVRGFLRELGVTLVLIFLLYFLTRFEPVLTAGLARAVGIGERIITVRRQDELRAWVYIFIIVATAFVSYEGETLAFGGQPLRGVQGVIMGLFIGIFNGYIIAGTIWYYLHRFGYPIRLLGVHPDELSSIARSIIPFLPVTFLGGPILMGQSLLLYLLALLLLARVIR